MYQNSGFKICLFSLTFNSLLWQISVLLEGEIEMGTFFQSSDIALNILNASHWTFVFLFINIVVFLLPSSTWLDDMSPLV